MLYNKHVAISHLLKNKTLFQKNNSSLILAPSSINKNIFLKSNNKEMLLENSVTTLTNSWLKKEKKKRRHPHFMRMIL